MRCAASLVIAAYEKYVIPRYLLRLASDAFYEAVKRIDLV